MIKRIFFISLCLAASLWGMENQSGEDQSSPGLSAPTLDSRKPVAASAGQPEVVEEVSAFRRLIGVEVVQGHLMRFLGPIDRSLGFFESLVLSNVCKSTFWEQFVFSSRSRLLISQSFLKAKSFFSKCPLNQCLLS